MDLNSYTSRLTNIMLLVKLISTRPQIADVSLQPVLRFRSHVFVHRNSSLQPAETEYKEPQKVFHHKVKYYKTDKNGSKDKIGVD